jgi:TonB family protein
MPIAAGARGPTVDPTLDLLDGSEAIELEARLDGAPVLRRYLASPAPPRLRLPTWLALGGAALLALLGLVAPLLRAPGLALLWIAAAGLAVHALIRAREERRAPELSIGAGAGADLPSLSPQIPTPRLPLVRGRADGLGYELLVWPAMSGELSVDGASTPLDALWEAAAPVAALPVRALALPRGAAIRLSLEPLSLVIRSVRPARLPSRQRRLERGLALAAALSVAVHLVAVALVAAASPVLPTGSLGGMLRVIATRFGSPPPGGGLPSAGGAAGRRGTVVIRPMAAGMGHPGASAPGARGGRRVQGRARSGLYGLRGPADNPDPHLARALAEHVAARFGVLGLLRDAPGEGHALGADARGALDGLVGNPLGEAYGVGGLGLVGTGRGGGGQGEGTIGLGTLGTIGRGGGGSGYGVAGGVGRLSGRRARAPCVGGEGDCGLLPGSAEVRGSLDREVIRRVVRRHLNEVRYCYQRERQTLRTEGRVVLSFVINDNGSVVRSSTQESALGAPEVERCLESAVRRWLFPKPRGGGIVVVNYPFVFRQAGGAD